MAGRIVGIGPQLGGPGHTVVAVGHRGGQIGDCIGGRLDPRPPVRVG